MNQQYQAKSQQDRSTVVQFLAGPGEFVFDLDGSLLGHNLNEKPEIQAGLLRSALAASRLLQNTTPVIATNKTAAEMAAFGIHDIPVFVENCTSLHFPLCLTERISRIFPEEQIIAAPDGACIVFGTSLQTTSTIIKEILEGTYRDAISSALANSNWCVAVAADALDPDHPEVTLEDVMQSFGLSVSEAKLSASRKGNSGIFLKSSDGTLIPFDQALGKLVASHSDLWTKITETARSQGVDLSASSKAVSAAPFRSIAVNTVAGLTRLPIGKGVAIELQRALSGGRRIFFVGDAGNDLAAVERLMAPDLFYQMPTKEGVFLPTLSHAAQLAGCLHFKSTEPAPLGIPHLLAAALRHRAEQSIDPQALRQSSEELERLISSFCAR